MDLFSELQWRGLVYDATEGLQELVTREKLTTYIDWMFLTFVITLTGCPAISLPCGLTRGGLPVGVQLVGRPHGDGELLGYARRLEQALGFELPILPA